MMIVPETHAFPERGIAGGKAYAQRLLTPEGREGGGGFGRGLPRPEPGPPDGGGGYGRGLPRPEPGPPDGGGGYGRGLPRPDIRQPESGGYGRGYERREPRPDGGGNRFWGGPYWGYGARLGHPCRWCSSNCADGRNDERCRRCESRCGW